MAGCIWAKSEVSGWFGVSPVGGGVVGEGFATSSTSMSDSESSDIVLTESSSLSSWSSGRLLDKEEINLFKI